MIEILIQPFLVYVPTLKRNEREREKREKKRERARERERKIREDIKGEKTEYIKSSMIMKMFQAYEAVDTFNNVIFAFRSFDPMYRAPQSLGPALLIQWDSGLVVPRVD